MSKTTKNDNNNNGLITLIICGILAVALMVGCIFFPEQLFGLLK